MADSVTQPDVDELVAKAADGETPGNAGDAAGVDIDTVSWAQLWQIPALLLGLGVFALGLFLVYPSHDPPAYADKLDELDALIRTESPEVLEDVRAGLDTVQAEFPVYPPESDGIRGRFWQYAGDLNYLDLRLNQQAVVNTANTVKNREKVLEYYDRAETFGHELDARSRRWRAMTLLNLNRPEQALAMVDELDPLLPKHRYGIVRQLIEREAEEADPDFVTLETLLERFEQELAREPDDTVRLDQRVWAVALKARRYLDARDPVAAIDHLNLETQRLRASGRTDVPELITLLAEAHRLDESYDESRRLYLQAQRMLPAGDGLNAMILLGLAEIERVAGGDGYAERAHELYRQIERAHPGSGLVIDALIGQADLENQTSRHSASIDHYREAVARLRVDTPAWDPRRTAVIEQVAAHVERAREQNRFPDALDLLSVAAPLYGSMLPAEIIKQFAQTHEAIAEQRLARGNELDPLTWTGPGDPPVDARRLAYQDAATHFGKSAEFFLQHARRVVEADDLEHGGSLYAAARNFDRAQLWAEAIKTYDEFLATRARDGQFLQAQHQLAAAYQADRQYQPAIDLFQNLLEENPTSQWAMASLVPLARSYIAVDRPADAISTLRRVLENNPAVTPDSETYRDALIDLARTYYVMGEDEPGMFARAIEYLKEGVERYDDQRQGPELHYLLGDALRLSVAELDAQLALSIPQRQRREIEAERDQRLAEAQQHFGMARAALEARHELALSPLEKLYRRNAWFYEADAAFQRGDFATAIDQYRDAAGRWQGDPASLVAWVQIVNAYCEMGNFAAAKTANNKALLLLERIDEAAFDKPEVPMTRRHWQDWLRWTSELDLFEQRAALAE
ncbi:MAG: tetratricopeptide repeat protein [Planctomycetota bacterium]